MTMSPAASSEYRISMLEIFSLVRLHYQINALSATCLLLKNHFRRILLKRQNTAVWNQRDRKLATECIIGMYIEILQSEPGEEDPNT